MSDDINISEDDGDRRVGFLEDDTQGHRFGAVEEAGQADLVDEDDVEGHILRSMQDGGIEDRNR